MPTVRDGRGKLTSYETTPPPSDGVGPVERSQVSAQRMADFAAERAEASRRHDRAELAAASAAESRARGAKAGGFVKGATKTAQRWNGQVPGGTPPVVTTPAPTPTGATAHRSFKLPQDREERYRVVLDAVRGSKSHAEAGKRLRVTGARVAQIIGEIRRAGQMPADVAALLRARAHHKPLPGSEAHGREEGAPATDAATVEVALPADLVATTPPSPPEHLSVLLPCVDCVHAAVCSIKPLLDALEPVVESPHPAVFVDAVSLTCRHFLEAVS